VAKENGPGVNLYHRTQHATAILRDGFRDDPRRRRQGVWLSDVPLDEGESIKGCTTLVVQAPADALAPYRIEQGRSYLEWCVPASILNGFGPPAIFADDWAGHTETGIRRRVSRLRELGAPHLTAEADFLEQHIVFLREHGLLASE
jgi:hypothetical protein